MIAADTSSLQRYLRGERGRDVDVVDAALAGRTLVMPPMVLTELLSDPSSAPTLHEALVDAAVLVILQGYWERAGLLRRGLLSRGYKAKVADALVAQSCIDHNVRLITHDRGFRHFVQAGLKLA